MYVRWMGCLALVMLRDRDVERTELNDVSNPMPLLILLSPFACIISPPIKMEPVFSENYTSNVHLWLHLYMGLMRRNMV